MRKPFLKKSDNKIKTENQGQNATCEQKKLQREIENYFKQKLGLKCAMNELGKIFRKNSIQKIEKTVKIQSEIAACE